MKKGWKIFWIVCACLAGFGIILVIGGGVMGATFAGVEHALWGTESRVEATVEKIEETIEDYDDGSEGEAYENQEGLLENSFSGDASEMTDGTIASLTGIEKLEVEVTHLQVVLLEGTGEEIAFKTENIPAEIEDELMFVQDGDELEIGIRNHKSWSSVMKNRGETGSLIIQVPKDHQLRSMSFAIGAGWLDADNITVDELDIKVGAGLANINRFSVSSLEVEVGAGEAELAGTITGEANIECGIGLVNYQATGSQKDYSYDLEVGAGSITVGNDNYTGLAGGKQIMNGGPVMDIECGIGEVNVEFTGSNS